MISDFRSGIAVRDNLWIFDSRERHEEKRYSLVSIQQAEIGNPKSKIDTVLPAVLVSADRVIR